LVEQTLEEYLERRIDEPGLSGTLLELRAHSIRFEGSIGIVHHQANALLTIGAAAIVLIVSAGAFVPSISWIELAWSIPIGFFAFLCLAAGFRRKRWRRFLGFTGLRPIRLDGQPHFEELLADVHAGARSIMRIADSGTGATSTPTTHRPVDLVIGKDCLTDPWLASVLLGKANADRQFIVIGPEPAGAWFNYYLWNEPVAARLLKLFDDTPDIYPGDPLRRTKVRVALQEIVAFVARYKQVGRVPPKKEQVVTALEKALKMEASRLLAENAITQLEERQLCRLSLPGEPASTDPAETSGNRGKKPESWFLNLMSGQYAPVNRHLSETVRSELNLPPSFVA
jgi:hypothetical protein